MAKDRYIVSYSLLYGETCEYGKSIFTHANSKEEAMRNFRFRIGKDYKRTRDVRVSVLPKKEVTSGPSQLSMFQEVSI